MNLLNFASRTFDDRHVHITSTEKFKTNSIVVTFLADLTEKEVTANAILPHLLMRGSQAYPTSEAIQRRLSELYGASLGVGVGRKGETQLIQFVCKVANSQYFGTDEPLLKKALDLMADIILRPVFDGNAFLPENVAKEKEQHIKRIDSLLDDKIAYATERCLESMTSGERFSIPRLGRKEDLEEWNERSLYDHYQKVLQTFPLHIHFVGNVDQENVADMLTEAFSMDRTGDNSLQETEVKKDVQDVRYVTDRLNVNQGKLNLGMRTGGVTYTHEDYPALVVCNGILGGFPHSKLFVNVREKESLAYYASSRLEAFKGILYVQSGIEIENYEKALSIMKEQLHEMKEGQFSDQEISFTLNGLVNQYRTALDSPESLVDVHLGGIISGVHRPLEEQIQDIEQVKKTDIQRVAQALELDTVYFLRDKEEHEHA